MNKAKYSLIQALCRIPPDIWLLDLKMTRNTGAGLYSNLAKVEGAALLFMQR
jgi:hypothetical protein